jgi:hypothetical protein
MVNCMKLKKYLAGVCGAGAERIVTKFDGGQKRCSPGSCTNSTAVAGNEKVAFRKDNERNSDRVAKVWARELYTRDRPCGIC